ncbi:MAG TPA: phage tail protein [Thermoanaerobaculia bacterium]|nr:phage tail protein [Thermoanaerobaculia bacterium]
MANEAQNRAWPSSRFVFSVQFGDGTPARFQEMEGLDAEAEVAEYRHGNSPVFYPIKMPGLGRVGNVTMRRGLFVNDAGFRTWLNEIEMSTVAPRTVVVHLLDEAGAPKLTWTLNNARPIKITSPDLKSEGNEVAIESVELTYETLTVTGP